MEVGNIVKLRNGTFYADDESQLDVIEVIK